MEKPQSWQYFSSSPTAIKKWDEILFLHDYNGLMIEIRTAKLHDIPDIVTLVNLAYRGEEAKKGWTTEAYILDGQRTDEGFIEEILSSPQDQIELALMQGQVVGCVHIKMESPIILYFGMLTVNPHAQGQGVGNLLLNHIENMAYLRGAKTIRMSVIHLRDELITYYKKRGFKETGKWEEFPAHDPRYGIPKIPDLKLLEFTKDL